ncbi:MAG TPA: SOS response-associated peptidase family protein [Ignavibacteria bacterium]|nr:SOS response-associated peptidase family protein [Ignavibacteria bacterium]
MCGRFEAKFDIPFPKSIWEIIDIPAPEMPDKVVEYKKKDVRPTNSILVIKKTADGLMYDTMKWGITVPLAAGKEFLMINSKTENIKIKTIWKNTLAKSPVLIPMTGFYEWKTEGKTKTPYKFTLKNHEIFFAAGYSRIEKDKKNPDAQIECTTIITTTGNALTRKIHPNDRSPVILTDTDIYNFLNEDINVKLSLCEPLPANAMSLTEESP